MRVESKLGACNSQVVIDLVQNADLLEETKDQLGGHIYKIDCLRAVIDPSRVPDIEVLTALRLELLAKWPIYDTTQDPWT